MKFYGKELARYKTSITTCLHLRFPYNVIVFSTRDGSYIIAYEDWHGEITCWKEFTCPEDLLRKVCFTKEIKEVFRLAAKKDPAFSEYLECSEEIKTFVEVNDIADYLLDRAHEMGLRVTNLKLQKLLYYAQGWFLAFYNEPLFSEDLQAWVHGPVQPEVYHRFKRFKWDPITTLTRRPVLPKEIEDLLEEVLVNYGKESAFDLMRRTHQEPPWQKARKGFLSDNVYSAMLISIDEMKHYFQSLLPSHTKEISKN